MNAVFPLDEQATAQLAGALWHFLWQALALAALTSALLYVLAPRRPQVRYAIYCGLLFSLAAAPVITFIWLSEAEAPATLAADTPPAAGAHMHHQASGFVPGNHSAASDVVDVGSGFWRLHGNSVVVIAWLAGAGLFGLRMVLGGIGFWRIKRQRQALPAGLAAVTQRLIDSMAFRVRPTVHMVENISQAIAVGVLRPMVLLPVAWVCELQPNMLEAVLAHELAHLRRWDLPVNLLQRCVESLLFFHPVVWWCSRQIRLEREQCCDQRALEATGDRVRYAEALTFLAERQNFGWEPLLATGIGGSKMALLERVRRVLGLSQQTHGRFYGPTCALVGAAAATLIWAAVFYGQSASDETVAAHDIAARIKAPPPTGTLRVPRPQPARTLDAEQLGSLPSENKMRTLPDYIIEPPDILFIEAIRVVPKSPTKIQSADTIRVQLVGGFPAPPTGGGSSGDQYLVSQSGKISLGPAYGEAGQVQVAGLTDEAAASAIIESLKQVVQNPQVSVELVQSSGMQPITGEHLVAPDGTVNLGGYGRVQVAGKNLEQARAAIEKHLETVLDNPNVFLSMFAFNSQVYYLVMESAEGDRVSRFPITGNETVLDALSQVNDLGHIRSKHIWIARPLSGGTGCDVILPVHWDEITSGGSTASNYQIFPGDRIFVSSTGAPPVASGKVEASSLPGKRY